MKRLLFVPVLMFVPALCCSQTVSYVTSGSAGDSSGSNVSSISMRLPSLPSGAAIVLAGYAPAPGVTIAAVDSLGGSFTTVASINWDSSSDSQMKIWCLANASAGNHTITMTLSPANPYPKMFAVVLSGASTSNPCAGSAAAAGYGTAASSGNVTVSTPNSMIVGFTQNFSVETDTVSSPYTLLSSGTGSGYAAYATASAAGSYSPTFTLSGLSSWVAGTVEVTPASVPGQTWYIRPNGGTRYSANVTSGQCDGKADVDYPGTGSNQHCAFDDFRYLYDDDSGIGSGAIGWVISGGDTVIVRGCKASATQVNAANPDCRIGWDGPTGPTSGNWCYGVGNSLCYSPPIPSGTSTAHTRILGQNYGSCNTHGSTNPAAYESNLTQLFAGFGLDWSLNLSGSSYVDIQCIELTTHNQHYNGAEWSGNCTGTDGNGGEGLPAYPVACIHSAQPYDDFAQNGILTTNTTTNINLSDVYVHGFGAAGANGPIGAAVSLTRTNFSFNAMAAWNFDDGSGTANGAGATLAISYATWIGNGCYEEYPIVHTTFPARACYDTASNGFGDTLSGQSSSGASTSIATLTADHIYAFANTKDGFIGPHVPIGNLTVTDSFSAANMGVDWKWAGGLNSTVLFQNNLTVGNCWRMSQQITGASKSFAAQYGVTQVVISGGTTGTVTMSSTAGLHVGDTVATLSFNSTIDEQSATVTSITNGTTAVITYATTQPNGTYTNTSGLDANGWLGDNGAFLTLFCRAGGNALQVITRAGSTNHYYGNTYVAASNTVHQNDCGYYLAGDSFNQETNCGTSPFVHEDEMYLGYTDPNVGAKPWLWYQSQSSLVWQNSYNNYFGVQSGAYLSYTCNTGNILCDDPLVVSEPTQTWPGSESALDVFNPLNGTGNSFYPSSSSPLIGAGTTLTGLSTDYYGVTRPSTPTIGAVEPNP